MAKKMTEAAKKAMAQRGTFEVGGNTDHPVPYSPEVITAVAPFMRRQRWMMREWGGSLASFVPPSWGVKYDSQADELHTAMVDEDIPACVRLTESLCRAIEAMHNRAKADGHDPMPASVLTTQRGGKTYMIAADGDISLLRRQHPQAVVYTVEEAAAALDALSVSLVGKITEAFPSSRITRIGGAGDLNDDFEF